MTTRVLTSARFERIAIAVPDGALAEPRNAEVAQQRSNNCALAAPTSPTYSARITIVLSECNRPGTWKSGQRAPNNSQFSQTGQRTQCLPLHRLQSIVPAWQSSRTSHAELF